MGPLPRLAHRRPGGAGVEPDVKDVRLLLELRPAALLALRALGEERLDGPLEPGVRALLLEDRGDEFHGGGVDERLAIGGAIGDRDRNAPASLAGYAPVGAVLHHSADAVLAPGRNPSSGRGDLVDGLERRLADGGLAPAREIH